MNTPTQTRSYGGKAFALVVAALLLLSWLRLSPGDSAQDVAAGGGGGSSELVPEEEQVSEDPAAAGGGDTAAGRQARGSSTARGGGAKAGPAAATGGGGAAGPGAGAQLECAAGKNGGATDTGVTASKVRLATTAVLDGPAKSLLEESPVAMKAVVDKVNKAGGVCGRLLDLTVVNDTFQPDTGLRIIKNFIAEGYFALPVVPSAEGLGAAIEAGEITKARVPVIGTDGMRNEQYGNPYVWPVASATVTAMRVMAKYGFEKREARTFALVYDEKYKFGEEGRDAFVDQVKKLGGDLVVSVGIDPDAPSYGTQVNEFKAKCQAKPCGMVAMLLLPETAKKWLQSGGSSAMGERYTAGAQTLFTDRFAQDCVLQAGSSCNGFAVWTGYNPPIGPLASLPGVSQYVNDVKAVKSGIDVNNQFVEGAYLGMSVFVEALKKVGPNLTRERLTAVLDSMTHTSDLASPLTWAPGKHAANVRSQSFSMSVSSGTFRGWSNEGTGFLLDPAHGG